MIWVMTRGFDALISRNGDLRNEKSTKAALSTARAEALENVH